MLRALHFAVLIGVLGSPTFAGMISSSVDPTQVPAFKKTNEERYLSTQDAHALLRDEPQILFVDVRDPVEVALSGRPASVDAVVPLRILAESGDHAPDHQNLVLNPNFMAAMDDTLAYHQKSRHDLVIITCGSGRRSAEAARILAENGYTNVWHIPDGYEGDDQDGFNTANAWKLAGLPWTMDLVLGAEWQLRLSE